MKLPLQPRHSSRHLAPVTSPPQPVRGKTHSFIRGAAPSNKPRKQPLAGALVPAITAARHVTPSASQPSHSLGSTEQQQPAPSPLSAGLTSAQQFSSEQARPQVPFAECSVLAEPTSPMGAGHCCRGPSEASRRLLEATKPQAAALGATDSCRNLTWQEGAVSRAAKERLLGQRGCVIWFTGLSGSGKSTVAITLEHALATHGRLTTLLDGDNIRHGLNCNLGFSPEDREENIRRIGEVSKLMMESGLMTLASFISPYQRDRELVRSRISEGDFIEVHMNVPLEVCESRDPKGLYKLARAGKIRCFTGVDDPYEPPLQPEIVLQHMRPDGSLNTPEDMAAEIVDYLQENQFLLDRSRISNGTGS